MKYCRLQISVLFFLLCANLHADILHLKDGRYLEGRISIEKDGYLVTEKHCKLLVKKERVLFFEKKLLPREEYLQRSKEVKPDDIEANYILGLWCKQHKMTTLAEKHFNQVFKFSPNHKQARKAAGYMRYKKEWFSKSEYMRKKGYTFYNGKWFKGKKAEKKIAKERNRILTEKARKKTIKIFADIMRNKKCDIENSVDKIIASYPYCYSTLSSFSSHYKARVRAAVIKVISEIDDKKCTDLLCKRSYLEKNPAIQKYIAEAVADHPQKEYIKQRLISILIDKENHTSIRRITYTLSVCGDSDIIPLLIEKSDHSPAKPAESEIKKVEAQNTTETETETAETEKTTIKEKSLARNKSKPILKSSSKLKPVLIYPAAECLEILTGKKFGSDKESWLGWWQENKDVFVCIDEEIPALKRKHKTYREKDLYRKAIAAYGLHR